MKDDVSVLKKKMRLRLRTGLESLPAFYREEQSAEACLRLHSQPAWKKARSILFYAPLPNEVNIWALLPEAIKAGKTVLLPKFDGGIGDYTALQICDIESDFLPGKFGIMEPISSCSSFPLNQLDLTLVPGIGFDAHGGRLGRGGGFYDRLLARVSGIRCGIAFEEQMVPEIPVEPHDIRMNCVLTPERWLETTIALSSE